MHKHSRVSSKSSTHTATDRISVTAWHCAIIASSSTHRFGTLVLYLGVLGGNDRGMFIFTFAQALKLISDIIERGVKDHPELMPDGELTKSVGNTLTLQETALIEAFNLKVSTYWSTNHQPNRYRPPSSTHWIIENWRLKHSTTCHRDWKNSSIRSRCTIRCAK
jgi:hypothetical protein